MKGDITRASRWLLANGAMAAGLWFGIVQKIDGAYNVGLLILWVQVGVACLLALVRQAGESFSRERRSVPNWISEPFRLSVLLFLAWHGAWLHAGAWAVTCFFFWLFTMSPRRDRNVVDG